MQPRAAQDFKESACAWFVYSLTEVKPSATLPVSHDQTGYVHSC